MAVSSLAVSSVSNPLVSEARHTMISRIGSRGDTRSGAGRVYGRVRPLFLLALGMIAALLAGASGATAQSAARPRLAVLSFQNNSSWGYWGDKLGLAASDELTTQLVNTGAFSVIERAQINAILAEQHLDLSGAVDPSTAVKVGKLLGAQAVLLGSITRFSITRKSAGIGPFSASLSQAESSLDVRVVNTTTGEIMVVAEGSGTKSFGGAAYKDIDFQSSFDQGVAQAALRPAVSEAVKTILGQKAKLAKMPGGAPAASIVGGRNGSVYIDHGQNFGVTVGQRFDVYHVTDVIKDTNGNVLDKVTSKVGVIEVTRVLSKAAICKIVSGQATQGDTVKPEGS